MNGACAPFGGRRARCARAAWGDGPVGPFGVIPKPFRMVSYSEAISNGKLSRSQSDWKGHSEWMALPNRKLFHVVTHVPCVHAVGKKPSRMAVIWLDFDASPPPHPQDQEEGGKGPNDPWDPLGYAEAIPKGKLFRTSPNGTDVPNGPFRGFTQTRKRRAECLWICFVGFERILAAFIGFKLILWIWVIGFGWI